MHLQKNTLRIAAATTFALALALPAQAFELFGYKIFERSKSETVELIDPLPYQVKIRVTGDGRVDNAVRQASALWQERERPASGTAGLLAKARGDYEIIIDALYGVGHYGGQVSITIGGAEVTDLPFDLRLAGAADVEIRVTAGPQFSFSRAEIINGSPKRRAPDIDPGYRVGAPALAGAVAEAGRAEIAAWRDLGHAKATISDIEARADHQDATLSASIVLEPGRIAQYGDVAVTGESRVNSKFIKYMADLPQGAEFSPDDLAAAQRRLSNMGTFRALRIDESAPLDADGNLPIEILIEDRKPRRFGVGATLSTLDGAGFEGFWLHRNLFGRAERLRFDASIEGVSRSVSARDYDYQVGATLTVPGVLAPDSSFRLGLDARQLVLENYRERSITALGGFKYTFSEDLVGFADLLYQRSKIEDDLGNRDFSLYALDAGLTLDRRDDPLNATTGYYLSGRIKPFHEARFGNNGIQATSEARAYARIDRTGQLVVAARMRVGTLAGAPSLETPPSLLFFTGGGGSVRGLEYRSIGVELPGGEIIGGRSLIEGSFELRARVTDKLGFVGFVDTGVTSGNSVPDFSGDFRSGAGIGIRYQTGLGPLRLDLAAPLGRRSGDPRFAIYLGLGQAF